MQGRCCDKPADGCMIRERSEFYQQRIRQFIEEVTVYPVSSEKLSGGRGDRYWLEVVIYAPGLAGARLVQP